MAHSSATARFACFSCPAEELDQIGVRIPQHSETLQAIYKITETLKLAKTAEEIVTRQPNVLNSPCSYPPVEHMDHTTLAFF